jgi:hypothetical protein
MVGGVADSTCLRRVGVPSEVEDRAHHRLVMHPVCATIDRFSTQEELLRAFLRYVQGAFNSHQSSRYN